VNLGPSRYHKIHGTSW